MLNNKNYKLKIIGSSNSVECAIEDTTLSYKRAVKAKKYIVAKGVEKDRIECRGLGGSELYTTEMGGEIMLKKEIEELHLRYIQNSR